MKNVKLWIITLKLNYRKAGIRIFYAIQKEVRIIQNSQAKNGAALKSLGGKRCEIKGGGQEITTKMLRFISLWPLFLAATFDLTTFFRLIRAAPVFAA